MENTQKFFEKNIGRLILGGFLGGLTGYLISEIIIAGINDFEQYDEEEDEYEDEDDEEELDDEEEQHVMTQLIPKTKKEKAPRPKRIDYQEFFNKHGKPSLKDVSQEVQEESIKIEEKELRALSYEESFNVDPSFKKVNLRFYKRDGIAVNDDTDDYIIDPGELLGEENLEKFGLLDQDADKLVVLDEENQTVYYVRKTKPHEHFHQEDEFESEVEAIEPEDYEEEEDEYEE